MYLFSEKVPERKGKVIMRILEGAYTEALIFTDNIEEYALAQIQQLCDYDVFQNCKIRVMPDVHPGKVGPIGFTSTIGDKILPNIVGIDIGCGITMARLKQNKVEFQKLDRVIRENIPVGSRIRKNPHRFVEQLKLEELKCFRSIQMERVKAGLGTLGSGNHFIELDKDENGNLYVVIHTGSRHLGKEVTDFYLSQGQEYLREKKFHIPYELTYLEGNLMEDYLHDMQIVQEYAACNRQAILDELVKGMKWKIIEEYSSVHNYVDKKDRILRKGAVSAHKGETVLIPINMRDGLLLGTGLGNQEWNYSAPHGSGRILRKDKVKEYYTVSAYKKEMKGIYSSCLNKETLAEGPFAYRGIQEILEAVADTVAVQQILKPIYNYKSQE